MALLLTACAQPGCAPGDGSSPAMVADELVATDRAFSASSAKVYLVSGLSAMFAPDVAMPIPGGKFTASAAEAIAALNANPDNAHSRAEWVPVGAGVSADGEQGYTWGYMTLVKPDGTNAAFKYLSYWVKRAEGWRVVAYRRRPRGPGEVSLAAVAASLPAARLAPSADAALTERYRASLDATERAFSDDAKVAGLGVAFARYGRADAVNMGGPDDAAFVVGSTAIGNAVSGGKPAQPSTLSWAPDRTIVATSGDLGVTIGRIRENTPGADPNVPTVFPFFTVWQRANPNEPWRYVAE
ncbi:MAG: DUF4440 domain-containing protein [Betaproteobacteria bacterium]